MGSLSIVLYMHLMHPHVNSSNDARKPKPLCSAYAIRWVGQPVSQRMMMASKFGLCEIAIGQPRFAYIRCAPEHVYGELFLDSDFKQSAHCRIFEYSIFVFGVAVLRCCGVACCRLDWYELPAACAYLTPYRVRAPNAPNPPKQRLQT